MISPFSTRPLARASMWRRVFGLPVEADAQAALENLLAEDGGGVADISRALRPYRLSGEEVRALLKQAFAKALLHFLSDDALDEAEHRFLADLRRRLGLSDMEIASIEETAIHPRYAKALAEVLADRHISEIEREALEKLAGALRLAPSVRQRIYGLLAGAVLQSSLNDALRDRRLSDTEEADLKAMAENLGLTPTISKGAAATMDRFRLLWRIDNGDIPPLGVGIRLQKDEVCYFEARTEWHERRSVTRRASYAGPAVSIPIVKGVRFRVGSFAPAVERGAALAHIDTGSLYITNQRVLFDGSAASRTIRLSRILSYEVFSDAIVLEKDSGRSPHLFIKGDIELAAVILGAVLGAGG